MLLVFPSTKQCSLFSSTPRPLRNASSLSPANSTRSNSTRCRCWWRDSVAQGRRKSRKKGNKIEKMLSLDCLSRVRRAKKKERHEKNCFSTGPLLLSSSCSLALAPLCSSGIAGWESRDDVVPKRREKERRRLERERWREERERAEREASESSTTTAIAQRQRRQKQKLFFQPRPPFLSPFSFPLSFLLSLNKKKQQQRHLHGARHLPHRHLRPRDAAPRRLEDHRRRQQRQGRPRPPERGPKIARRADHDRRGGRLRLQRHVRRRARPRRRERVSDRLPALLRGHHRHLPRRAAAEGLRPRVRDLAVHRDQHLREHRLEGLLALHRHGSARLRVRGGRHRAVPPAADARRQGQGAEGGVLPLAAAQRHKPARDRRRVPGRHLLPGLPRGPPRGVQEQARGEAGVPDQAVLHEQHADHPAGERRRERSRQRETETDRERVFFCDLGPLSEPPPNPTPPPPKKKKTTKNKKN